MKVVIAGYGAEGKSNYEYYHGKGYDVAIADERESLDDAPEGAELVLGEGAFSRLADYDIVVRTAGLAPRKIETDGKIWSATNEFFRECETPIIGITGSKGKGTTASFITDILRADGKTVELVGNIGVPALSALGAANNADVVVYELSSFQLWDLERSPHIALVLYIEPEHLDIHTDLEDYLAAKSRIVANQTRRDYIIYNADNFHAREIASGSNATKLGYPLSLEDMALARRYVQLPGQHNLDNACAAIAAARIFDVSEEAIEEGLSSFTGLEHRLKLVHESDTIKFYDDSIATTPGAAIAAIKSFKSPKLLILGGSDKGADYTELAEEIAGAKVRHAAIIGSEREKIEAALDGAGWHDFTTIDARDGKKALEEAVETLVDHSTEGDVLLLSPSAASFGLFKNYSERGDIFIDIVTKL